MKIQLAVAALLSFALCASTSSQSQDTHKEKHPTGTKIEKKHSDGTTEVQPDFQKVRLNDDIIRAAQTKLNDEGYKTGTPDGRLGAKTRAAIRKYQQDKNLKVSGQLDESTLSHLNVGAGHTMATAPSDIGRGAKAAGHDFKEGHPVAALKAIGKGFGHAGKAVGEGTKSGVVGTTDKIAGDNKKKTSEEKQPPR
jgi:peptidoglycan hydrolase-like protein with peptidoglycan-binding domain